MVREKVYLLSCPIETVSNRILQVARLPPLPKLRIRKPNKDSQNPCVGVMSQLLGCWASSGYSIEGCGKIEESLRLCMDNKVGLWVADRRDTHRRRDTRGIRNRRDRWHRQNRADKRNRKPCNSPRTLSTTICRGSTQTLSVLTRRSGKGYGGGDGVEGGNLYHRRISGVRSSTEYKGALYFCSKNAAHIKKEFTWKRCYLFKCTL